MKKIFFFIPNLFLVFQVFSQSIFQKLPYDNVWLLGRGELILDFNQSPPLISTSNLPIQFDNTNASICDTTGSIRLYSNGLQVYNSANEHITGGFRINNNPSMDDWLSTGSRFPQGMLILPTTNIDMYHLFYTEHVYFFDEEGEYTVSANNILYAEADFSSSDTGQLIDEDFIIVSDTLDFGKITACRHGNGRDWWVTVPSKDANQLHRLLVSENGITNMGALSTGNLMRRSVGQAKFSPDGNTFINYGAPEIGEDIITFYDFDRCTGELFNPRTSTNEVSNLKGGISISENSRFAYQSSQYNMYQYDLKAEDIIASKTLIGEYDGFYNGNNPNLNWTTFALSQLGPDGRIYIAISVSAPQMHLVHEPNKRGKASRFEQRAIEFPVWNTRTIPNFPYYGLGPWDGSPCDTININNPTPEAAFEYTQDTLGQQIEFFDASHYAYEWEWSFGDGSAVSNEQHPVHIYEAPGAYEICLSVSNVTGSDMHCETVYIGVNSTQEVFVPGLSVSVSPNPFQEQFSVRLSGYHSPQQAQLRIYNVAGQQILESPLSGQGRLGRVDGSLWPAGLYFYEVWEEKRKLTTGKIIKQE